MVIRLEIPIFATDSSRIKMTPLYPFDSSLNFGFHPNQIFDLNANDPNFEEICLAIFRFQAVKNPIYSLFLKHLGIPGDEVYSLSQIPFLPIEFFKTHQVVSGDGHTIAQKVFTSSGTSGMQTSRHEVLDIALYQRSFRQCFQQFYGDPKEMSILALLPSYLEREGSSLIFMVDDLIEQNRHRKSGYFLYNHEELSNKLIDLQGKGKTVLLLGVSYALLDFAEYFTESSAAHAIKLRSVLANFPELIIMETGGMKGRRREMIREELHQILQEAFQRPTIHSEYGMTELLSQAYSKGKGIFECPPWMKIILRDTNDPFSGVQPGQSGGINVIDLANLHSCSFIATQDLGKMHPDGRFEVLGRFDQSDIRGCNLLIG